MNKFLRFHLFQPTFETNVMPVSPRDVIMASQDSRETIEAQRRRRDAGGPRGRAEMPGRPSSGGGGTGSTGGGGFSRIPGGKRSVPVGVVILILVCYFAYTLLSGGADDGSQTTDLPSLPQENETEVVQNTSTPRPTRTPGSAASGSKQTWTVMLYQDADDSVLEQDIYMDLNEAERIGSSDQVNVVAQIDRYAGAYTGDGDWTSARRYYLTQDDDLFHLNSEMLADLGEVSMADPQTLVDFATWAIETYPADKYVLILSDHGMGWPGGWTDPKPAAKRSVDNAFSQGIEGNMIFTNELDQALGEIRAKTGLDRFELVGMDACLMSHLEVLSALEPHTRYVVTSQETEPSLGWAYTGFLEALEADPGMDGAGLGDEIVSTYIEKDERIVDDQARADFLRQGSPMGGLFGGPVNVSASTLTRQLSKSITLTATDLDALPGLMDAVNQLAFAMQKEDSSVVGRARTYAQSFTSVFGENVPPSYIDLGNFAQLLAQETSSSTVRSAAAAVTEAVNRVVVAEKHGSQKPGATGISIYFPGSQLYRTAVAGANSYVQIADRFAEESLWDDYLVYYYTQTPFQLDTRQAAAPSAGSRVRSPVTGQIEISPIRLSATSVDYNQPVTMQSTLTGDNIGYVYLFVGYMDPNSGSILVADKDYLESPKTRQVGDLYYPVWSDQSSFNLKYTWTPTVFTMDDGSTSTVALFNPERYGASAEEAVYTSDGIYTDSATGESRYARMYFTNGQMTRLYGFTSMDSTGALHEIIPQTGDTITLIQTWLESDGSGGVRSVTEKGETLTFGDQMFTWQEMYAGAGDYVIGFVVSDLDGNETQAFAQLTVR